MINEENFITAHFIDNERKNIEILLKSDDGTAVNPHILEYDVDNPNCQELAKSHSTSKSSQAKSLII